MGRKRQRLFYLLMLVAIMGAGFALLATVLRQNLNGYATPGDLLGRDLRPGDNVSVGGLVLTGTLTAIREPLGSQFVISDGVAEIIVRRAGGLPDLFAEGELTQVQGPITALNPLTMNATKVLAKHDQYYVPVSAREALNDIQSQGPQ